MMFHSLCALLSSDMAGTCFDKKIHFVKNFVTCRECRLPCLRSETSGIGALADNSFKMM